MFQNGLYSVEALVELRVVLPKDLPVDATEVEQKVVGFLIRRLKLVLLIKPVRTLGSSWISNACSLTKNENENFLTNHMPRICAKRKKKCEFHWIISIFGHGMVCMRKGIWKKRGGKYFGVTKTQQVATPQKPKSGQKHSLNYVYFYIALIY